MGYTSMNGAKKSGSAWWLLLAWLLLAAQFAALWLAYGIRLI